MTVKGVKGDVLIGGNSWKVLHPDHLWCPEAMFSSVGFFILFYFFTNILFGKKCTQHFYVVYVLVETLNVNRAALVYTKTSQGTFNQVLSLVFWGHR